MASWRRSPWFWMVVLFGVLLALMAVAPPERTLGENIRTVYLHGAWVWAALAAFLVAGGVGVAALALRKPRWHAWSRAWGRTGVLLWVTYLPLSLWAMQTNWNGLYLAEPRWRLGLIYAVTGLLLQVGLAFFPASWASAANALYIAALLWSLAHTEQVMHPPSPMLRGGSWAIHLTFVVAVALMLGIAWQIARLWMRLEQDGE